MKLIEYKPEINTDFSSISQVMTVKEVLGLLYETKLKWRDPEGLDEITPKLWEVAKPKYYHDLAKKYPAPIIFGTMGDENVRIPHPISNETLSRELQDIQDAHEFCMQKSWDMIGIPEIRFLANSFEQEAEWIDRKNKCPLLTVKDLQWVDNMVDEIFDKHTKDLSIGLEKQRRDFWGIKYSAAILVDKFIKPIF